MTGVCAPRPLGCPDIACIDPPPYCDCDGNRYCSECDANAAGIDVSLCPPPSCDPGCEAGGFTCCDGKCVNPGNDILNCGACGNKCGGPEPFCDGGQCGTPPCSGNACNVAQFCCGSACCDQGQLCCEIPGPVSFGTECITPDATGTCPKGCLLCACASPLTPIATPQGERPIASLREGDLVYSVHQGQMAVVPLRLVHSVQAPEHVVVKVTLEGGITLEISGPHPTADGRTFSQLRRGDRLDGRRVLDAHFERYQHPATHDILPDSDSGTYFAAGVLIGTTLAPGLEVSASFAPRSMMP